ncbi:hypothetical protein EDD22DRAFT_949817 [Suillus occidentalis]|nr:hypothetical protein EDD22DRAFT_949817 [Suillus occidentalis]
MLPSGEQPPIVDREWYEGLSDSDFEFAFDPHWPAPGYHDVPPSHTQYTVSGNQYLPGPSQHLPVPYHPNQSTSAPHLNQPHDLPRQDDPTYNSNLPQWPPPRSDLPDIGQVRNHPTAAAPSRYHFPDFDQFLQDDGDPRPVLSVDGFSILPPGVEEDDIPPIGASLAPLARRGIVTDSSGGTQVMDPGPGESQSVKKDVDPADDRWRPYDAKRPRVGRGGGRRKHRAMTSQSATHFPHPIPLKYDRRYKSHKKIFKDVERSIFRHSVEVCSFVDPDARKTMVMVTFDVFSVVIGVSTAGNEAFATLWARENEPGLYKDLVERSTSIMPTCKRIARTKIQRGYKLRPSVWSNVSEPDHQMNTVRNLIYDKEFPLKYIFGKDDDDNELYAFEHEAIWDVVLDAISELKCREFLTADTLDNIFCSAAAAIYCALKERAGNGEPPSIDFTVANFRSTYESLMNHITNHINSDEELRQRWNDYKHLTFTRVQEILK